MVRVLHVTKTANLLQDNCALHKGMSKPRNGRACATSKTTYFLLC